MTIDGKLTTPFLTKSVAGAAGAICAVVAAGFMLGGGCGEDTQDIIQGKSKTETALALTSRVDASTNVSGMQFAVERVACSDGDSFEAFSYEFSGDLEDMNLPSHLEAFHPAPADGSEHAFADHFVVLNPGCYDITATPLEGGAASDVCSPAFADGVLVEDGRTTEVLLMSQCEGAERGALDIIAAMNTAPHIETVVYNPSKFVGICQDLEICVTAKDPNNDPLDIVLARLDGPNADGVPSSTGSTPVDGGTTECFTLETTAAGTYEYQISVYDLMPTEEGGMMRIEDYLAQLGHDQESNDTLTLPVHSVDTDEEFQCNGEAPEPDAGNPTDVLGDDDVREQPDCVDYTNAQLRQTVGCHINGGTVTFTLPDDACPELLSWSSYSLDDNNGVILPYAGQKLYDNVTDTYGPGEHTVTVEVPTACGYQVDLYTGEVMLPQPRFGHGDRLLCATAKPDPGCEGTAGDDDERPDDDDDGDDDDGDDDDGDDDDGDDDDGDDDDGDDDDGDDDDGDDDDGDDDDGDDDDGDDDGDECVDECTLSVDADPADAASASVTVTFMCDMVYVESSKDLSNVVVEYASGTVHKFDNLSVGTSGTFGLEGEGDLVTVWVKSGSFQSADGPGYGYRFDVADCSAQ